MKTKLEMAHDWMMKHDDGSMSAEVIVFKAWQYADAMQAEVDKRSKAEAEQKRKAVREMLNADNTFLEKEGQHFDDVEWQPDWSKKTNEELRILIKTLDGIIESRSDCNHEWDHISAYGGSGNYYVCSCGAEKHPMDDF